MKIFDPSRSKFVRGFLSGSISDEELDRLQREADDIKVYMRLTFVKLLYSGETLAATAEDIGVSQGTASNWVTRWNEGGLGKLTPYFGGGFEFRFVLNDDWCHRPFEVVPDLLDWIQVR